MNKNRIQIDAAHYHSRKKNSTLKYNLNNQEYKIVAKVYTPESGGTVIDEYQIQGMNGKLKWVNPNSLSALPKNAPNAVRGAADAVLKKGGRRTKRRKSNGRNTKRKTRR